MGRRGAFLLRSGARKGRGRGFPPFPRPFAFSRSRVTKITPAAPIRVYSMSHPVSGVTAMSQILEILGPVSLKLAALIAGAVIFVPLAIGLIAPFIA